MKAIENIADDGSQRKQLAKLLMESCINSKWFQYTQLSRHLKGAPTKISDKQLIDLIINAPREANEAAYYSIIERALEFEWKNEDLIDELTVYGHLSFDNIWMEDDAKQPGQKAWCRIKTDTGFKIVHVTFIRMPLRNIVQKEHDMRRSFSEIQNEINRISKTDDLKKLDVLGKKLRDSNKRRIELLILKSTMCAPVMAKVQRTKTKVDFLAATEVEICEDQDMYERLELARKSKHIKVNTIYNSNTSEQVHYMRQRGISKQRAEIMANLEGTSITYDLNGLFETQTFVNERI